MRISKIPNLGGCPNLGHTTLHKISSRAILITRNLVLANHGENIAKKRRDIFENNY